MDTQRQYPDISDILARKARGREERAHLSFGEKLEILDKLRMQLAPINAARLSRHHADDGFVLTA
jgi:hypothetical protein